MMRPLLLTLLLWLLPSGVLANDELITVKSAHSAQVTAQRLQEAMTAHDWTVLGTIDHAAHAAQFGIKTSFRTTIAFAYMRNWAMHLIQTPTVAIEVPFPVLVWENAEGVWVTRNDLRYYMQHVLVRHQAKGLPFHVDVRTKEVEAAIDSVTR